MWYGNTSSKVKVRNIVLSGCLFFFLFSSVAFAASDKVDHTKGKKHSFTVATGVVMNNPIQLAVSEMCRRISQETGGRITFSEHHNASLGSERELLEQATAGMLDIVAGGGTVAYNFVKNFGVFDLPYIFMDQDHAKAVLKSDMAKNILKEFDGTGVKAMGWIGTGWRSLTANEPILTPNELAGKKIRAMENEVYIDMYKALGASPTPMAFTELYTALQQGTVDGMDNPPVVIDNGSLDDVQKYLMLTEHTFAAGFIAISQETFDALSPEDQVLFESVADELLDFSFDAITREESKSIKNIEARGHMQVLKVDKQLWANAMRVIYPKYKEIYGKELVDNIVNFK